MGETMNMTGRAVRIEGIEYETFDKYLEQVRDFNKFKQTAKRFQKVGWISENTLRSILIDSIILMP